MNQGLGIGYVGKVSTFRSWLQTSEGVQYAKEITVLQFADRLRRIIMSRKGR